MATLVNENERVALELEGSESAIITLKESNSCFEVGIVELPSGRQILRIYFRAKSAYLRTIPDGSTVAISICPDALLEDKEALQ